jgi:hypothetical protein
VVRITDLQPVSAKYLKEIHLAKEGEPTLKRKRRINVDGSGRYENPMKARLFKQIVMDIIDGLFRPVTITVSEIVHIGNEGPVPISEIHLCERLGSLAATCINTVNYDCCVNARRAPGTERDV